MICEIGGQKGNEKWKENERVCVWEEEMIDSGFTLLTIRLRTGRRDLHSVV